MSNLLPAGARVLAEKTALLSDRWAYATKAGSTSRSSTTTRTADPDLSVSLPASSVWAIRCTGIYVCTDAIDFVYDFTYPSGATLAGHNVGPHSAALTGAGTSGSSEFWGRQAATSPMTAFTIGGSTTDIAFTFLGLLVMSSTAGALTLRWNPGASSATATILRAGSHLIAQRVDG